MEISVIVAEASVKTPVRTSTFKCPPLGNTIKRL